MSTTTKDATNLELSPIELNRIAPPPEAEHLSSLSWDTLKRRYPQYVIKLSERREGMRVCHALLIGVAK